MKTFKVSLSWQAKIPELVLIYCTPAVLASAWLHNEKNIEIQM